MNDQQERGKVTRVGDVIQRLVQKHHLEKEVLLKMLQRRWYEVLNPSLARVSQPIALEKETLVIRVIDVHWKKEFTQRKAALLRDVIKFSGRYKDALKDVKII